MYACVHVCMHVCIFPLMQVPAVGPGRLLTFATPCSLETLVTQIKAHLSLGSIRLARPSSWEEGKEVASLAVCVGSGASLLRGVRADVYLTGKEERCSYSPGSVKEKFSFDALHLWLAMLKLLVKMKFENDFEKGVVSVAVGA